MQEKICNKCGLSKILSEYHSSKTCKYSVRNTCKECRKIERKEYKLRPDVLAASKKYYQDNKDSFRERMNNHYHTLNGQYHQYKKRAKKANLLFEFSENECLLFYNTNCYYCGDKIKGIGIDRLDNSIGYTKNNCVPCCSTCNFMKHVLNIEEFKQHLLKIINHLQL